MVNSTHENKDMSLNQPKKFVIIDGETFVWDIFKNKYVLYVGSKYEKLESELGDYK